jgi:ABC-type lipoprotein release transport system permease subunit
VHLTTAYLRSLRYHWRAGLAVALGALAGSAVLTGALLVGTSMRGSLRAAALDRLGRVEHAWRAPRFFRAALAADLAGPDETATVCPLIMARASATHAASYATAAPIQVFGVDERFWQLGPTHATSPTMPATGRVVWLNQALADDLAARAGDDVLLRLARPAAVSPETLLGRRDDGSLTMRLTVDRIIAAESLGAFTLSPQQGAPRNAYVPLATLQRLLDQPDRANTLLTAGQRETGELTTSLKTHVQLADLGLRLRPTPEFGYVALESDAFLLPTFAEAAARAAVAETDLPAAGVLAYLANEITGPDQAADAIPYSTVAAVEPGDAIPLPPLAPGEIALNDWAATNLDVQPGRLITLAYYVLAHTGELRTERATFRLRHVLPLHGPAADPGFTPDYPGITDATGLADWDPPFPIDLTRIRDRDEDYWDAHRTTPKAFVTLTDGQRLWTHDTQRLGRVTSFRVYARTGEQLSDVQAAFARCLHAHLDPAAAGLRFDAIRARALTAGTGTTDFAGLFIGFSFLLIISAALLVGLLFRLNIERRCHEVGLLLALGFTPPRIRRLLLAEGLLLAAAGAALGLLAARGYAALMLHGLRTWWAPAVNTPFLGLYETPLDYLLGFTFSLAAATAAVAWSLRGLVRMPARALLAGVVQAGRPARRPGRAAIITTIALLLAGLAVVFAAAVPTTAALSQTLAFFLSGTCLLLACLTGLAAWLHAEPHRPTPSTGRLALLRLGLRNARRRAGRSLLTAGLIAAATFLITSLHAMRLAPPPDATARDSGTGGFTLLAEATVPLHYDPNTPAGRAALGLPESAERTLAGAAICSFRLQPGDDASCLNLYRPTQPTLLGAPPAMIQRGGFGFSATLADTPAERENPWLLLQRDLPDGVVPAIADAAAAQWQLHVGLGQDVTISTEHGQDVRLRIVALLRGSCLQGPLIVAESQFKRLFPSVSGHAFFLIETASDQADHVEQALERGLSDFGLAATSTRRRLAELQTIQNTYLSTFQTLGGLGLLLGTGGLAVVLLRNIWERRGELALLQALGFSRAALHWLVLSENALLVGAGLATGLLSAAVVAVPHVVARAVATPWPSLLLMFAAIFAAGLLTGYLALAFSLRASLLPALRSE